MGLSNSGQLVLAIVFHFICYQSSAHDVKGFDDTVLFNLAWLGKNELLQTLHGQEEITVTTTNKEKYKCIIPSITPKETSGDVEYSGPSPIDLLFPLFSHPPKCSYRIETYWTYEICHGNYIKQYHEERHEKTSKLQEYYLGRWDKQKTALLKDQYEKTENEDEKLKFKKIDGLNLPYFEIEMDSGTMCDLNFQPRVTKVLYVCYLHGKNEVYSLKETSTCNYEVIILTPLLCTHPKYKPQDTEENKISCMALDNSPKKPKNLLMMEIQSMKMMHQTKLMDVPVKLEMFSNAFPFTDDRKGTLENEIGEDDNTSPMDALAKKVKKTKELKPLLEFLEGTGCLTGGSGWWKFELCFGKSVRQYHEDTSIILGYFDQEKHLEWLEKNPSIRHKRKNENQLSNFYSGGEICDKTQRNRQVEVKLKCTEHSASSTAIALYLLEPRPCEYILNVESSLICDILSHADENMLLPEKLQLEDETLYIIDGNNISN